MFNQGELVIHPKHGVGTILSIEDRTILSKKKTVYKILMNGATKTQVMVPADRAEDIGLRYLIDRSEVDGIWNTLASTAEDLPEDNRQRVIFIEKKLHASSTKKLAELLRDINWRKLQGKKLNQPGRVAYDRALESLVVELAVAQDVEQDSVRARISGILHPTTA